MNKLILIDAGHGGIIEGHYVTPGKRYYDHKVRLAEGALNRHIVYGVANHLHYNNIPVHIINPESQDISLKARAIRVNKLSKKYYCFLLSIHHNAFEKESAHGVEFFTSRGDTKADPIAEFMASKCMVEYPNRKLRYSRLTGRLTKEAGYTILKSTICPAVLSEWSFMTNRKERNYMMSGRGIVDEINFLTDSLIQIHNRYI